MRTPTQSRPSLDEILTTVQKSAAAGPLLVVTEDAAAVRLVAQHLSDHGLRSEGVSRTTAAALQRAIQERFELGQLAVLVTHPDVAAQLVRPARRLNLDESGRPALTRAAA